MNVLPCELEHGKAVYGGLVLDVSNPIGQQPTGARLEIGVRPEFVSLSDTGIPVRITKVSDAGRFNIVDTQHGEDSIKLLVPSGHDLPSDTVYLNFDPAHTQVYADDWMIS